jgi:hypothetical protein
MPRQNGPQCSYRRSLMVCSRIPSSSQTLHPCNLGTSTPAIWEPSAPAPSSSQTLHPQTLRPQAPRPCTLKLPDPAPLQSGNLSPCTLKPSSPGSPQALIPWKPSSPQAPRPYTLRPCARKPLHPQPLQTNHQSRESRESRESVHNQFPLVFNHLHPNPTPLTNSFFELVRLNSLIPMGKQKIRTYKQTHIKLGGKFLELQHSPRVSLIPTLYIYILYIYK